jgi:L-fucose mutarotase/ribose pyranase (RbsD/FucU family)
MSPTEQRTAKMPVQPDAAVLLKIGPTKSATNLKAIPPLLDLTSTQDKEAEAEYVHDTDENSAEIKARIEVLASTNTKARHSTTSKRISKHSANG